MTSGRLIAGIFAFVAALCLAGPLAAEEEILNFVSDVDVHANGDFIVTETIEVRAEGIDIRRGIYRDFPTAFIDDAGRTRSVGFELLGATRDGKPENWRTESVYNAVRVYLGQEDVYLSPGVYTYVLTYRTDRQVRFFEDHDEVYWNATGTEWDFPILQSGAIIRLPEGARVLDTTGYTGSYGSTEQNYTAEVLPGDREVRFEATVPLGRYEGLTIAVSLAKGAIAGPTEAQKRAWFLRDNLGTVIAAAGAALVFFYYLVAWGRVGRDPPEDIMVPRWDLPDDISPALAHYIWYRGLTGRGFPALSAATLNLAVNGYVALEDIGDTLTLTRTEKPARLEDFPVGEAAVLKKLGGYNKKLKISKTNGSRVAALGNAFRSAIEGEHRAAYYRQNGLWAVPGVVLSVVTFLGVLIFGDLSNDMIGILIPGAFTGVFLTVFVTTMAKQFGTGLAAKIKMAFAGFILISFVMNSGLATLAGMFTDIDQPYIIGALVTLVITNLLFFYLLGAPTALGQQKTAEIRGLRHYLSVAEKDRMNMAGAPQMSPQHFETLLPYAVALGVEKPWSKSFESWLASAIAEGSVAAGAYNPGWYRGDFGRRSSFTDRVSSLGSSLSSSMTASLPAPKSSSSGFSSSGGSSGGGGGGGGGGGW